MKPSGLGWAPVVPDDWAVVPLRYAAKIGTGHTPDRAKPEYWQDCTVPWVTASDLSSRRDPFAPLLDTEQYVSELGIQHSAAVVHPAGTVMLCRTASVGLFTMIGRPMATTQAFVTWTPIPGVLDPRFLLYTIAAMAPEWDRLAYGSTHRTIYMPDLEGLRIPLPPLDEQRRIADFLDADDQKTLGVLDRRRAQLALLGALRETTVRTAVIGGQRRERRPTSLPWATSIPSDWAVAKLTTLARLGSGHTPSRLRPDWWVDTTIPWVTTGEVAQMRLDRIEEIADTRERISRTGLENSAAVLHPRGTVVLCRTAASAGFSAVMGLPMATSQDFATWTCGDKLDPFFLLWTLRAMRSWLLGGLAIGSTHKTIYMPDIQALRIPLPSLAVQRQIVARLREDLAAIDDLAAVVEIQDERLVERRQALITAAVTGRLDVTTARSRPA